MIVRCICLTALAILLSVLCGDLFGVERFPPPDFDSGYALPEMGQSAPRAGLYEYLDVAVLLAALSLVTYLALKKRSRRGIFLVGLFSLIYFGFWRKGCVCSIGSIQNVTLALVDSGYTVPFAVIAFFTLPLAFTLFFGRTFCAGVCPFGALQDLVSVRPIQIPSWLESGLGLFAYLYLGGALLFAATGSAFIICEYDPFVAFFRRSGSLNMFALGGSFLLIGLFIERPYCRFFCPYGVLLNLVSRASKWHVDITPSECIQCHLCADACPVGVIRKPTAALNIPSPAQSVQRRGEEVKRLAICIILLPLLIGAGGWIGVRVSPALSRVNPTVRLAERVWLEDTGRVEGADLASQAFRAGGRPSAELYEQALSFKKPFAVGGGVFGAFIGLAIGIKLIFLSIRRRGVDYEINRGGCVSCGRCFDYCPVGKEIEDLSVRQIPA